MTTCILWNVVLGVPIYALGLTNHLTALTLGVSSALFSTAVLVTASWRRPAAPGVLHAFVALTFLPFDGLAIARRARSVVLLPLTLAGLLIVYTAVASYFTPSWRQWDSLWYHETIIGFTLQNHGFAPVDLPSDLQKVNGYPRFCEMIQLWFIIFTDRRLIELTNSLVAPAFMYATYVIARRYTRDAVSCMGWAAVVMLMPTASYLLESTYIDLHVALFVLAGTHYATRPVFRLVDAWLATACVVMAVGAKYLALPPMAIVTVIALVRLLRTHGPSARSWATIGLGFLLITGMGWTIFWRNWVHYKNPFWPDLQYDNARFNIHLPFIPFQTNALDMNIPLRDLLGALYSVPYSVTTLGRKGQLYEFGFAATWIVFLVGGLALLLVLFLSIRDWLGRHRDVEAWRCPEAVNALLVALPAIVEIWTSPALWGARYHLATVAALTCLIAFWSGRRRWYGFGAGLAAAACVTSIIAFIWVRPRWLWLPSELVALAKIPYPEREVTPASAISTDITIAAGSAITRESGLARERLKPGDIVAIDDYVQYPALLWNNAHTDKLVYVPSGDGFFERVSKTGAKMIYCRPSDPGCDKFTPENGWRDLGPYNVENWGKLFERVGP